MKKILKSAAGFSAVVVLSGCIIGVALTGIILGGENLFSIFSGLLLSGFVAGSFATLIHYLSRSFLKPKSDASIAVMLAAAIIIMSMHTFMMVELRSIKKEFLTVAENADAKILWRTGEIDPSTGEATNPISYGGKIDAVIAKRNAFLKKRGYVGLGSWYVGEYREAQFQMVYIWFPLTKLWG